jgi:hypothetical protein
MSETPASESNLPMDLTEENLETFSSIRLHNMTVDELVSADSKVESRFHYSKGVWWREVKPFFYQPAFFMERVASHRVAPKPWLALGGYYHMVPEGCPANGSMVVVEVDNPAGYRLEEQSRSARRTVKRALATLRIRPVVDMEDLLVHGYDVYQSWEERTSGVRVKRSSFDVYKNWIAREFQQAHNMILGAYLDGCLIAYLMGRAVQGVLELTKTVNDSRYWHFSPSSALIYASIVIAGNHPEISKVTLGLRSHKASLEEYKMRLGAAHVSYPAYIHIRPLVRPLVARFMPREYHRLMGEYEQTQSCRAQDTGIS